MQYRIQFIKSGPDNIITAMPIDAMLGAFASVHEAAKEADRRMREAERIGASVTGYMIVDMEGRSVDPLGKPIR